MKTLIDFLPYWIWAKIFISVDTEISEKDKDALSITGECHFKNKGHWKNGPLGSTYKHNALTGMVVPSERGSQICTGAICHLLKPLTGEERDGPHEIFRGIPTQAESQRTNEISPFLGPRALCKARNNDNYQWQQCFGSLPCFSSVPPPCKLDNKSLSWELPSHLQMKKLWGSELALAHDPCPWEGPGAVRSVRLQHCALPNPFFFWWCPSDSPLLSGALGSAERSPIARPLDLEPGTALSLPSFSTS